MLYIIYKTQYSSWFFLCTWGRGSMALHETLHIYMSFHLREIRQALSRPCTRTWIPGSRVSGFSCRQWSIVAPWLRRPACEKEKRSGFVFSLSFFFCFFSFLFTLQRDSGGLRPELLVTRDSCVLRSPAGLKPDKDYHTLEMLYLPVALSEDSFRAMRLILSLENRDESCTGSDDRNVWNNVSHWENNV